MSRSFLWLAAIAVVCIPLVLYGAGCGEIEVGHQHADESEAEHAEEHAEGNAEHEHAEEDQPEEPKVDMGKLEEAAAMLRSSDPTQVASATELLMKVYGESSGESKKRAGEILADAAMNDPDPNTRAAAITAMGADPTDAFEVALEVSRDKVPSVAAAAAPVIAANIGNPAALKRLRELAQSTDQHLRGKATEMLAYWQGQTQGGALRDMAQYLGDPKGDASTNAVLALHQSGKRGLPIAAEVLRTSPNPRARAAAADALALICAGTNPVQQRYAKSTQVTRLVGEPHEAYTEGFRPLLDGLKDPDPYVREVCAQGLGYLGDAAAAAPLAALLTDSAQPEPVRRRAAAALVTIPAASVRQSLEDALATDKSPYVRRFAAEALLWTGAPGIVEPLMRAAAADPSPVVRAYAAQALGKLGDARATQALMQLYQDPVAEPSEEVRWAAVEAQAKLADPTAREALARAVRDPSPMVAVAAEKALRKLGVAARRGLHLRNE